MNATRPRIAFLSHTAAASGAELAMMRVVGHLHDSGSHVQVLFTESGPVADRLRERGVPTRVIDTRFESAAVSIDGSLRALLRGAIDMARAGWQIGAQIRDTDVLVAESSKALLMGFIASRRARVPLIWRVHDRVTAEYFGTSVALIIRILGWTVCRGYLANSRGTLTPLIRFGKRCAVAYPGIEPTDGAHSPARDPDDVRIVMVGRLEHWKGQDLLLDAAAACTRTPHITFVGGAHFGEDFRDELEHRARLLGITDRVSFTGHVDDVMPWLLDADILVHCTRIAEPFGQVVVEGMDAGCAVVASRNGGPAEIVTDGVDGILIDPLDTKGFARALDELISDRVFRERAAAAARISARRFSIGETATVIETFVTDLIDGRRARGRRSTPSGAGRG